jgi:hypothetical protein
MQDPDAPARRGAHLDTHRERVSHIYARNLLQNVPLAAEAVSSYRLTDRNDGVVDAAL